ncbi:DUF5995 family protein [Halorientalis halophila]|uniref:DUF5995 family protein n=1 Tax=Halorientalis halophila TaxID=3108499 RepID=UPI003009AC43
MSTPVRSLAAAGDAARLLTPRRLREMALALRRDVRQFEPPSEPDPALVSVVREPYDSVEDAAERLRELEARLADRGDRRAVFLTVYTRMTERIRARIADGYFADPAWMRTYTTTFANYYRRAFLAFERGEVGAVPDPWRVAFGTALRGDALASQDAFLGINAHINYDLALTLADVGIDPDRAARRDDHRAVDGVLARLVDVQQEILAETYAAGVADVDVALGRLDERLSLAAITGGREYAWRIAVVLADAGWGPVASVARWVLRATATGGAFVLRGPPLDPAVTDRLRAFEREGATLETLLATLRVELDERADA